MVCHVVGIDQGRRCSLEFLVSWGVEMLGCGSTTCTVLVFFCLVVCFGARRGALGCDAGQDRIGQDRAGQGRPG